MYIIREYQTIRWSAITLLKDTFIPSNTVILKTKGISFPIMYNTKCPPFDTKLTKSHVLYIKISLNISAHLSMKIILVDPNLVRTFLVIIFLILIMVRILENNNFLVRTKLGYLWYTEVKYQTHGGQDQHGCNSWNNGLQNQTSWQMRYQRKKQK